MKQLKHTKRIFPVVLLGLALTLALTLTGCSRGSKIQKAFVLSESQCSMMTGETKALSLENPKNKDVGEYTLTWMSEDSAIATVADDGTVTAVAPGTTTVKAKVSAKKAEVFFDCTVTVTQNTTPPSSISFLATVYSLGEGQSLDLKKEVSCYPSYAAKPALVWNSSNTGIATVTDGVVRPVTQGITTITASTEDGALSASCMIRVSEISVDPTGISLDRTEASVEVGKTLSLAATVEPNNATGYAVVWSTSDSSVATVTGGTVTGVSKGKATVTARLNVGGGKILAECVVTVVPAGSVVVPATTVQLSPTAMTIAENSGNGPFKFGVSIAPANYTQKPVWSTNRPDLLQLNSSTGEFTLIKAPTLTTVSVIVTCTVGEKSDTAVVNISPRKPELQINVGNEIDTVYDKAPFNTVDLIATMEGQNTMPKVAWSSSNASIASVDENGTVTAHKAGTCTITAQSKEYQNVKATYTVTVEKADYLSLKVGETIRIDASLIPEDPVNWNFLNTFVELDEQALTVKGLKECLSQPTAVTCFSKSTGAGYSIDVYILPRE